MMDAPGGQFADMHMMEELSRLNNELITTQRQMSQQKVELERRIAQIQALQTQLVEAEREKVLMQAAGGAAHEINQPLSVIIGYAQILQAERADDPDLQDLLRRILEAGEQIDGIVKRMGRVRKVKTRPYLGNIEIVDFDGEGEGAK